VKPAMTSQTIAIEHVRIESAKSFADVRVALEKGLPQLDPSLRKALVNGDLRGRIVKRSKARSYGSSRYAIMVRC
jgi:hypothetical protein